MILPHVGLVLLLGLYTVCGAGVFHMIELPHEEKVRNVTLHGIWSERDRFLEQMWYSIQQDQKLTLENFKEKGVKELQELEEMLFQAYEGRLIEYPDIRGADRRVWTFAMSIFFAATVVTSIGKRIQILNLTNCLKILKSFIPEASKGYQRLPKAPKGSQRFSKAPKGTQRLLSSFYKYKFIKNL